MEMDELTAMVHQTIPILGQMGIEVVDAGPGHASALLPTEPNVNHFGVSYAGSLFSVGEMIGGVLSVFTFDPTWVPIAKELSIRYLKPATTAVRSSATLADDEVARVKQEVEQDGRSEFTLVADLTDEAGVVVARTEARYVVRRP